MRENTSLEAQPYWDGLDAGRLQVQRCGECQRLRHYPRPMCPHCHSMALDWATVSGHGQVHSWTVTHQTPLPGFADQVPYTLVTVDLVEGVRMLGTLVGVAPEQLRIGLPVRATVEPVAGGAMQPVFHAG